MRHLLSVLMILLMSQEVMAADRSYSTFTGVETGIFEALLKTLVTGEGFSAPVAGQEPIDRQSEMIWGRVVPEVDAGIESFTLGFARPRVESAGNLAIDRFSVEVSFSDSGALVVSSLPAYVEYQKGLSFEAGQLKPEFRFHPGQHDSNFVAGFIQVAEGAYRGLLLCPVSKASSLRPEEVGDFEFSGYKAESLEVKVRGHISVRFRSGSQPGRILAEIFTSPWVRPGLQHRDEVLSRDPAGGLDYVPDQARSFDSSMKRSEADTGVRALLQMQNGAGYTRTEVREELLSVKTVSSDGMVSASAKSGEVKVAVESCALVMTQKASSTEYGKREMPQSDS